LDQWLNTLNIWLAANPGWLAAAIAGTALVESLAIAGLAVPGVAMLFVIAAAAGHHDASVWAVMGWALLGAILGDGISFWIGRRFQGRIATLWPFSRFPGTLQRGERFFLHHGGKSVVLGRFVGPVRPIIPMVAGAFGMSAQRFLAFNVLSAIGWAPLYILPGFLVGASMAGEPDLPPHFYPVLIVSGMILIAVLALFFRVHLGLLPEGRLYGATQRFLQQHASTRRIWNGLARPRGEQREFPLASLALAVGATASFAIWTLAVIHTQWLVPFNSLTMQFFQTLRFPLLDPLFLTLTLSGDAILLGAGFVLFGAVLFGSGYKAAALHLLGAGIATALLTVGLKYGLYLARPETVDLPPITPAYPSGHNSGTTVLYGMLAAFVAQEWRHAKRWQVYGAAIFPVLLVALSRLYLGVHWFTDTVGGILLGLAICGVVRCSFSRYDRFRLRLRSTVVIALLAWPVLVGLYAVFRWQEAVQNYTPLAG
jgi:membrane protein DedA with SNARE-associated domain/membrane-associated phospholipid phosphatase